MKKDNYKLTHKIAKKISERVDMGLYEAPYGCFDPQAELEWGEEAIESQEFYLALAEDVIRMIRRSL